MERPGVRKEAVLVFRTAENHILELFRLDEVKDFSFPCFIICTICSGSTFSKDFLMNVAFYFQSYLYNSGLIRVTRRQGCIELCCRPYSTKLLHRGTTLNKNTSEDDI
jgi:hypothetical protein